MIKYLIIGASIIAVSLGFVFSVDHDAFAKPNRMIQIPTGSEQRTIVQDSKERITTTDDKVKTLRRIKSK